MASMASRRCGRRGEDVTTGEGVGERRENRKEGRAVRRKEVLPGGMNASMVEEQEAAHGGREDRRKYGSSRGTTKAA